MGIQVEFNPDLALRSWDEFIAGRRKKEECLPEKPEAKRTYYFLKQGQRNYWLEGEIPLIETNGKRLSKPLASAVILEATHFLDSGNIWTKGRYKIVDVFDDDKPRFDGFEKI